MTESNLFTLTKEQFKVELDSLEQAAQGKYRLDHDPSWISKDEELHRQAQLMKQGGDPRSLETLLELLKNLRDTGVAGWLKSRKDQMREEYIALCKQKSQIIWDLVFLSRDIRAAGEVPPEDPYEHMNDLASNGGRVAVKPAHAR